MALVRVSARASHAIVGTRVALRRPGSSSTYQSVRATPSSPRLHPRTMRQRKRRSLARPPGPAARRRARFARRANRGTDLAPLDALDAPRHDESVATNTDTQTGETRMFTLPRRHGLAA